MQYVLAGRLTDNASLDIGYYVSEPEKYNELREFLRNYLETDSIDHSEIVAKELKSKETFFSLLESELNKLTSKAYTISLTADDTLVINDFVFDDMELRFEDRKSYFRVDYRINQHYILRNTIFKHMLNRKTDLMAIFSNISFGTEMRRLKFDLKLNRQPPYNALTPIDLQIIWPDVVAIVSLLQNELSDDYYKSLITSYNLRNTNTYGK